jgi:hypothetical protein
MPAEFWAKVARSIAISLAGAIPAILLSVSGALGEIGSPTAVLIAGLLSVSANAIREANKAKPEGDGGAP